MNQVQSRLSREKKVKQNFFQRKIFRSEGKEIQKNKKIKEQSFNKLDYFRGNFIKVKLK